jgi:hypothetical protein
MLASAAFHREGHGHSTGVVLGSAGRGRLEWAARCGRIERADLGREQA